MLRPRWLALFAVALLLLAAGLQLARWQWQVAHDTAREEAVREIQQRPQLPLSEVMEPHAAFPDEGSGQRISARGEYQPGGQFLVAPRLLEGADGFWVVDQFVVEGTSANLPVVRGWVASPEEATAPPTGQIELIASLAPGEAPDTSGGEGPARSSIDLGRLVNEWPGDLYNGFGFAITEDGQPAAGVTAVPPPLPDVSFNIRNASYALQWAAFGAFAIWMWFAMVRAAMRSERPPPRREEASSDDPTTAKEVSPT